MNKQKSIMRNASPEHAYTKICNSVLQDYAISLEASGFMGRILSLPVNWIFHKAWALKKFHVGETKLRRILKELVCAGYCRIEQGRSEGGTFGSVVYSFTDVKNLFVPLGDTDIGAVASPLVENGGLEIKDSYKENKETKHTNIREANVTTHPQPEALVIAGELETKTPPIPQGGGGHDAGMTVQENDDSLLLDAFIPEDAPEPAIVGSGAAEQLPLALTPPEPQTPSTGQRRAKKAPSSKLNHNTDPEFEKFWNKYPKKVGKAGTYTHWKRFQKENPEMCALLPEAALEYESELRRQHKNSSEAKQMTCCGYNWFNKGLHESYAEIVVLKRTPKPIEQTENIYEQRAREEKERIARVAANCSGDKRSKFVDFLAKVYDNVKDAWNDKVIEYFHARKYWDIDALIPVDVKNEARARIGAPLLAV